MKNAMERNVRKTEDKRGEGLEVLLMSSRRGGGGRRRMMERA